MRSCRDPQLSALTGVQSLSAEYCIYVLSPSKHTLCPAFSCPLDSAFCIICLTLLSSVSQVFCLVCHVFRFVVYVGPPPQLSEPYDPLQASSGYFRSPGMGVQEEQRKIKTHRRPMYTMGIAQAPGVRWEATAIVGSPRMFCWGA